MIGYAINRPTINDLNSQPDPVSHSLTRYGRICKVSLYRNKDALYESAYVFKWPLKQFEGDAPTLSRLQFHLYISLYLQLTHMQIVALLHYSMLYLGQLCKSNSIALCCGHTGLLKLKNYTSRNSMRHPSMISAAMRQAQYSTISIGSNHSTDQNSLK